MNDTIARAIGRWKDLLPQLGVAPQYLVNRHGPCPICGGKDRFRFDDKNGSGSYFCNQCGPGTGIVLVQRVNGWTFRQAADAVDALLGSLPASAAAQPAKAPPSRQDRLARVEAVLRDATEPGIVDAYLRRRGLNTFPAVLRGHAALPLHDADGTFRACYPGMIAPVHGPDGSLRSAHRTYLADVEPRKKLMPPADDLRGGTIRLFEPGTLLGIGEGIETAIACHERFGVPVWAAISATILEGFKPPPGVERVIIFGDNDASFAGQKSALVLAQRLVREGFAVEVMIPPETGTDWLDVHNAEGARHAG
ncbi:MAG: toprim domain-containing protein [Azospirillaceae bacterium]